MQPCSVLSNGKTKASHVGPHKLGCCDLEQLIFCWVGSNAHFVPALTTWAFLFVSLSPDCLRCTRLIILFVSDRSVFASQQTCSCVGSEVSSLAFNDCSLNKCKKVCWFQSCCRAVVTLFFMSTLNESVQFKNSVSFAPQDSWVISGMWVKALPFSRSDFYHINTSLNLPLFQINSRVINVLFTVCIWCKAISADSQQGGHGRLSLTIGSGFSVQSLHVPVRSSSQFHALQVY